MYPTILCFPAGAQCETSAKADIVLVLDGSSSISPTSFQDVRSFVTNIVSAFDIGPDRVQIGTLHSNTSTHVGFIAVIVNVLI